MPDTTYSLNLDKGVLMPDLQSGLPRPDRPIAIEAPAPSVHYALSVVLPIYNEIAVIDRVVSELRRFAKTTPEFEFVLLDDGSADGTADRIELILKATPASNIRFARMERNSGKGAAICAGLALTTGAMYCFMDGDLAYAPEHLIVLASELETADVVIGSRRVGGLVDEHVRPLRRLMGWTFNKLARLLLDLNYLDTQAGIKGMRREAAAAILWQLHDKGFAFDVELLYLAQRKGLTIREIPVKVSPEHVKTPSSVRLFRDPLKMFKTLVDIRLRDMMHRYVI